MVQLLEPSVDLLYELVDHIDDPNDLTSLARVNRFFHLFAGERIWKSADRQHRYRILMWACATGNAPALRYLLRLGFTTNLNFQLNKYRCLDDITSCFYLQLQDESWTAVPYMDDFYETAAPGYLHDRRFWKPLHVAVYHGQSHIVDILLQHGASIDGIAKNYHGCVRPSCSGEENMKMQDVHPFMWLYAPAKKRLPGL
ncbi:hypothetical protein PG994_006754 [Apiospora phragmitis]|uniref:Uncharacterized protein n=1 Tax=Apiospora phragmitis TaxID=2905665 RepID=A0ABR1VFX7_9PEZI